MAHDTATLIAPCARLWPRFLEMALEHGSEAPDRFPTDHDGFVKYMEKADNNALDIGLPPQRVPGDTYWLVDDQERIIGTSRLRHRLVAHLEIEGGHIGYDIRPSMRRRGYGTLLLRLTCDKAAQRGLDCVLVTCDDDNAGSLGVICNMNGREMEPSVSPKTGKKVRRFWVELK